MNLLKETLDAIEGSHHTIQDIDFCAVEGGVRDFQYFSEWAEENFEEYDNGYGRVYVPKYTSIIFKDKTWLARGEYDGAEGWDYHCCPAIEDYI